MQGVDELEEHEIKKIANEMAVAHGVSQDDALKWIDRAMNSGNPDLSGLIEPEIKEDPIIKRLRAIMATTDVHSFKIGFGGDVKKAIDKEARNIFDSYKQFSMKEAQTIIEEYVLNVMLRRIDMEDVSIYQYIEGKKFIKDNAIARRLNFLMEEN